MHRHAFVSTALVCLLAAPAWGQPIDFTESDPTIQEAVEGITTLPTCKVELARCKATLGNTQEYLQTCRNTVKNTKTKLALCTSDLMDCHTDLDACEAEPRVVFPGDGYWNTPEEQAIGIDHGARLSYTDHGDGTITDNNTRLMWEKKDSVEGIHSVRNTYQWMSDIPLPKPEPNGSLFTVFLTTLNTAPCFAGYCDWRIPNIRELQSIVDHARILPAASLPGLGTTAPATYWSSTTFGVEAEGYAWAVFFKDGITDKDGLLQNNHAIAVRGGQG